MVKWSADYSIPNLSFLLCACFKKYSRCMDSWHVALYFRPLSPVSRHTVCHQWDDAIAHSCNLVRTVICLFGQFYTLVCTQTFFLTAVMYFWRCCFRRLLTNCIFRVCCFRPRWRRTSMDIRSECCHCLTALPQVGGKHSVVIGVVWTCLLDLSDADLVESVF